jgi:hypothetical protein
MNEAPVGCRRKKVKNPRKNDNHTLDDSYSLSKSIDKMKTIERRLYNYIDAQKDCEQMTRKGILISAPDIDWLQAEYTWVNTEDTCLSVSFFCPMRDFVKILGIRNIRDIDALSPGRLMELYYEGLGQIDCFISLEYTYCMSFKKQGNMIVAENERGFKHNVPVFEKLDTLDQYIAYANEYYKLMECNEN